MLNFFQRTKWRDDLAKNGNQTTTFMSNKNSTTVGCHFAVIAFKVPELYAGKLAQPVPIFHRDTVLRGQ